MSRLGVKFFLGLLVSLLFISVSVQAIPESEIFGQLNAGANEAGIATVDGSVDGTERDPRAFVGQIIVMLLSFIGTIFLCLIVYAGYLRMTAHGEEDKIKKSTEIVTAGIIGIAIVLISYAITIFVTENVQQAALQGTSPTQDVIFK